MYLSIDNGIIGTFKKPRHLVCGASSYPSLARITSIR
jgi:hypothetical protein